MQHEGQLAFDFEEFEREEARARLHEWAGAPLHFTTDYYPPTMLDEAFRHWRFLNGDFGSFGVGRTPAPRIMNVLNRRMDATAAQRRRSGLDPPRGYPSP